MDAFLLFLFMYFLISSVITFVVVSFSRKKPERSVSSSSLIFIFFFAPLLLLMQAILYWWYPPSGDGFDIVYTKLSFAEWKTYLEIGEEIKIAGQTLGGGSWLEEAHLLGTLEAMVQLGFARRKEEPIKGSLVEKLQNLTDECGAEKEETRADLQALTDQAEEVPEEEWGMRALYLRGVPPSKKGRWKRRLLSGLRPVMA